MNDVIQFEHSCAVWIEQSKALVAEASAIRDVSDALTFEDAGSIQSRIAKHIKAIEAERKAATAPLDALKKELVAAERRLAQPLADELARLKAATSAYATACAKARAEEEARRLAAERAAAEAAVAAEDKDPFGFNAPAEATPLPPAATPLSTSMPKSAFTRTVERWDFEVTDSNAVPRELCSPDPQKIRAFLSGRKAEGYKAADLVVPGLKIISTMQVQSR